MGDPTRRPDWPRAAQGSAQRDFRQPVSELSSSAQGGPGESKRAGRAQSLSLSSPALGPRCLGSLFSDSDRALPQQLRRLWALNSDCVILASGLLTAGGPWDSSAFVITRQLPKCCAVSRSGALICTHTSGWFHFSGDPWPPHTTVPQKAPTRARRLEVQGFLGQNPVRADCVCWASRTGDSGCCAPWSS